MDYEDILNILGEHLTTLTRTRNSHMYDVLITNYMSIVASSMRAEVSYLGGTLPLNQYSLVLAESGAGKNRSLNTLNDVIGFPFHKAFKSAIEQPAMQHNVVRLAVDISRDQGTDPDSTKDALIKEVYSVGGAPFTFSAATVPAIRLFHRMAIICNAGSLNLVVDEIGSTLVETVDALSAYLTLYDKGLLDVKILKGSSDNKPPIPITGAAPANLIMFGSPGILLDASTNEKLLRSQFSTGYARRLICAYTVDNDLVYLSPEDIYDRAMDKINCAQVASITEHFEALADPSQFKKVVTMGKEVSIQALTYQEECEELASKLPTHYSASGAVAELRNRAYRAIKMAGTLAFSSNTDFVSSAQLSRAIGIMEESGAAFNRILASKKDWELLVEYLLSRTDEDVTYVDILADLPAASQKNRKDLIEMAVAYGYKHNVVITRTFTDGVEFIKATQLEVTDINAISLSYSKNITTNFTPTITPFNTLHQLTQSSNMHFNVHNFVDGHRNSENLIKGFNLFVADIDGTATLEETKFLLRDYEYLIYTTKRHTEASHRFRLLMPLSHKLVLDIENFKEFYENIINWLPILIDESARDCSRKWATNAGEHWYNTGKMLEAQKFIPKTTKAQEVHKHYIQYSNLSNLERWCTNNSQDNRNNMLLRYGMVLVDVGLPLDQTIDAVYAMNQKFPKPMKVSEVKGTVVATITKKINKRE